MLDGDTRLWDLVRRRAEASGDRPMLIDEAGRQVTFGQFHDWAERVAAGLHELGVGPGTAVTWQLPTRIETIVLSMALTRLGARQNPIIHLYREREVGFALAQTGAEMFAVPGTWRGFDYIAMGEALGRQLDRPPRILVAYDELPQGEPSTLPPPPTAEHGGDWTYYTSGTTSEPKGVRHSDSTLIAGGRGLALAVDLTPDDVGSMAFPFAHIAGPDYLVMMLVIGMPAVLLESFVPADAVRIFTEHGVTMVGGSTAFYHLYLAQQRKRPGEALIPSLRLISGGGAPMPPEIFFEVQREIGIRVVHGYGMTEIPMICQGSPRDTDEQLAYTVGAPVHGAEVRIVTADEVEPPLGVDGEVRVRGPMVCHGYTDPEQTEAVFDADGWFRTGDIGHLRADGHVVLTGRLKDVIIRKGENISAQEIENLLYEHPKVGDVAVIGLPDRERGELVCAVVEQARGQDTLTFDEMVTFLRDKGLMVQKIPEKLEVVEALPRNDTLQKILKYKLRERYSSASSPGASPGA